MKRFLILFWVLLCSVIPKAEAQNVYVVSAGVADYPGKVNDLTLCASDAKAIARLYRKNAKAEVVLLTNSNATKKRIQAAARTLFQKAKPEDIVVFFFSGHGFPGGFVAHDDKLSYEEIRAMFASCKAKNKMVFADACFSGDIRDGKRTGHNDPKSNIMLFLSSRSNEYSIEVPSMRNALFASCLIRSLKGGADVNGDRIITAKELFDSVSTGVAQLSRNRQHPVMWGNFPDTMPVMVW